MVTFKKWCRIKGLLISPLILLGALVVFTGPSIAGAAEPGEHPHHLSLMIGVTEKSGKTAETTGVEYTYRLDKRWAIGAWYEQSFGDFELESMGVLANLYATQHFALLFGAGTERDLFDDPKYLGRVGASYQFHIGSVTFAPIGWVDFVENSQELYFLGFSLGMGF